MVAQQAVVPSDVLAAEQQSDDHTWDSSGHWGAGLTHLYLCLTDIVSWSFGLSESSSSSHPLLQQLWQISNWFACPEGWCTPGSPNVGRPGVCLLPSPKISIQQNAQWEYSHLGVKGLRAGLGNSKVLIFHWTLSSNFLLLLIFIIISNHGTVRNLISKNKTSKCLQLEANKAALNKCYIVSKEISTTCGKPGGKLISLAKNHAPSLCCSFPLVVKRAS